MQGLKRPKGPARGEYHSSQHAERLRTIPRGSSSHLPPVPAPSTPALAPIQCNLSLPFNAGLGNNPSNRDAYVRSCVNN